jgi:hypothetical protein
MSNFMGVKAGYGVGLKLPMLHKMSLQRHKVSSHPFPFVVEVDSWGRIQRKTCCMGPYVGVDYNLN